MAEYITSRAGNHRDAFRHMSGLTEALKKRSGNGLLHD